MSVLRFWHKKTGTAMLPLPSDEGRVKRRVPVMNVCIASLGLLPPHSATDIVWIGHPLFTAYILM